jgi:hypothetical protein
MSEKLAQVIDLKPFNGNLINRYKIIKKPMI